MRYRSVNLLRSRNRGLDAFVGCDRPLENNGDLRKPKRFSHLSTGGVNRKTVVFDRGGWISVVSEDMEMSDVKLTELKRKV